MKSDTIVGLIIFVIVAIPVSAIWFSQYTPSIPNDRFGKDMPKVFFNRSLKNLRHKLKMIRYDLKEEKRKGTITPQEIKVLDIVEGQLLLIRAELAQREYGIFVPMDE